MLINLHVRQVAFDRWQIRGYNPLGQAMVIVDHIPDQGRADAVMEVLLRKWAEGHITGLDVETMDGY